jgi:hypothetical protein
VLQLNRPKRAEQRVESRRQPLGGLECRPDRVDLPLRELDAAIGRRLRKRVAQAPDRNHRTSGCGHLPQQLDELPGLDGLEPDCGGAARNVDANDLTIAIGQWPWSRHGVTVSAPVMPRSAWNGTSQTYV